MKLPERMVPVPRFSIRKITKSTVDELDKHNQACIKTSKGVWLNRMKLKEVLEWLGHDRMREKGGTLMKLIKKDKEGMVGSTKLMIEMQFPHRNSPGGSPKLSLWQAHRDLQDLPSTQRSHMISSNVGTQQGHPSITVMQWWSHPPLRARQAPPPTALISPQSTKPIEGHHHEAATQTGRLSCNTYSLFLFLLLPVLSFIEHICGLLDLNIFSSTPLVLDLK
ncbi:hypothetical protein MUK42_35665 [Musa troglodytarum]|uniref:Uncharacterized protein n=1 Tax=Musa troglodytarum TaxID=320322 RepID=A0A9E7EEW6_9LILI|nr:hypothetical protein MUK42_35665 [Musa troglodytarum]